MRAAVTACLIIGTVLGRPKNVPQTAEVTRYDYNLYGLENYSFVVDTSDGFDHDAQDQLKDNGKESKELVVKGKCSYPGSDEVYSVDYVTEAKGFSPSVKLVINTTKSFTPLPKPPSNESTTIETIKEETAPPGKLCLTCPIPARDKQR